MLLTVNSSNANILDMKAIDEAIRICGGQSALAEKIGVTQSFVSQLSSGARPIPPKLCADIEAATGGLVVCQQLRPDVFRPKSSAA